MKSLPNSRYYSARTRGRPLENTRRVSDPLGARVSVGGTRRDRSGPAGWCDFASRRDGNISPPETVVPGPDRFREPSVHCSTPCCTMHPDLGDGTTPTLTPSVVFPLSVRRARGEWKNVVSNTVDTKRVYYRQTATMLWNVGPVGTPRRRVVLKTVGKKTRRPIQDQ